MKRLLLCAATLAAAIPFLPFPAAKPHGIPRVQDGDTIVLYGSYIRLFGIDAPELAQTCTTVTGMAWPCGQVAKAELARLIGGKPVSCAPTGTDRYQRTVAICHAGDIDLGGEMVRAGYAVAYTRYSARYVTDEKVARILRNGVWSGTFVTPEIWRREHGARLR